MYEFVIKCMYIHIFLFFFCTYIYIYIYSNIHVYTCVARVFRMKFSKVACTLLQLYIYRNISRIYMCVCIHVQVQAIRVRGTHQVILYFFLLFSLTYSTVGSHFLRKKGGRRRCLCKC